MIARWAKPRTVMLRMLPMALLAVAAASPAGSALAADKRCEAPDGAAGSPAPLGHVAAALRPGGTLEVLVIGSATVFGPEVALAAGAAARDAVRNGTPIGGGSAATPASASPPSPNPPPPNPPSPNPPSPNPPPPNPASSGAMTPSPDAFPMVMGRELEAAVPGATVHVTIRGARSLAAADMVDMIRSELAAHPYQLVVWQTGTLEAARNVQAGDFAQLLADGQQAAREAGADLVLVDPQYSRFLQTNANLDPYLQAFGTAAAVPDVVWFRRYDLMREWVSSGQIDLEHTARKDRRSAVELLHSCLGGQLARLVAESARS